MMIAIIVLLSLQLIVSVLIMFMVAAIVGQNRPKSYEEAKKELFEAWSNMVIDHYKKRQ